MLKISPNLIVYLSSTKGVDSRYWPAGPEVEYFTDFVFMNSDEFLKIDFSTKIELFCQVERMLEFHISNKYRR